MKFWVRVVLPFYLVGLGWIVFTPGEDAERVTGVVAWVAEALGGVGVPFELAYVVLEFLANIALFVPFGVLLALPTRFSTLSDVIANTLGTGIGVGVVFLLRLAGRWSVNH